MKNTSNFKISSTILLQLYLYLISFVSLIPLIIGIGLASRVLLSYKVSIPFSYTLHTTNKEEDYIDNTGILPDYFEKCYSGEEVITIQDTEYCFDKGIRKSELIVAISLILSMSFLFAIHQYGISKIKKENRSVMIKKVYLFLSLLSCSIVSIILIPVSIHSLAEFFLFEPNINTYFTSPAPAMSTTVMIILIPLWIYFLRKATQLKEK